MIAEDPVYRLCGWIRLVPGDGFGIALFGTGQNEIYIAETNDRLLIARFHAFYDEGYTIDYGLPPGHRDRVYAVGDDGSIPFFEGGNFGIVDVGLGSQAILKAYGAELDQGVVGAIARVVLEAETGVFERQAMEREAKAFEGEYDAVFAEEPVHSRYWVEQYEKAITAISDSPPGTFRFDGSANFDGRSNFSGQSGNAQVAGMHSLSRQKLKLIGSEWIRRFASSGTPYLLFTFLGVEERHKLRTSNEIREIYYNVFMMMIMKDDYRSLLRSTLVERVRAKIPEGIYYYELERSRRIKGKPSPAMSWSDDASHPVDLLETIGWMLETSERRMDFRLVLSLSGLLFGNRDLHPDVRGRAKRIANRIVELTERGRKSFHGYAPPSLKKQMITFYRALVTLRRMLDWENQPVSGARGLGLTEDSAWLIEQWLEEEFSTKPPA